MAKLTKAQKVAREKVVRVVGYVIGSVLALSMVVGGFFGVRRLTADTPEQQSADGGTPEDGGQFPQEQQQAPTSPGNVLTGGLDFIFKGSDGQGLWANLGLRRSEQAKAAAAAAKAERRAS